MLPHLGFFYGLIGRSALTWVAARGLLLFAGLVIPSLPAAVAIVALTAGLTTLDGRRHGETVLLANLGVPESRLALLAAVCPALFEGLIQVAA